MVKARLRVGRATARDRVGRARERLRARLRFRVRLRVRVRVRVRGTVRVARPPLQRSAPRARPG